MHRPVFAKADQCELLGMRIGHWEQGLGASQRVEDMVDRKDLAGAGRELIRQRIAFLILHQPSPASRFIVGKAFDSREGKQSCKRTDRPCRSEEGPLPNVNRGWQTIQWCKSGSGDD